MRPIVNMPEEDRATDIGNVDTKLVEIAHVVPEISSRTDRQTDRQTYSSQYFATTPAGEVVIHSCLYLNSQPQSVTTLWLVLIFRPVPSL